MQAKRASISYRSNKPRSNILCKSVYVCVCMTDYSYIFTQVLFNLASQYHVNRLYNEALNTYLLIVKNKMFGSGGRLRLNMGNIYFEQKKYSLAIKNYRMALDQIPDTHKTIRYSIEG